MNLECNTFPTRKIESNIDQILFILNCNGMTRDFEDFTRRNIPSVHHVHNVMEYMTSNKLYSDDDDLLAHDYDLKLIMLQQQQSQYAWNINDDETTARHHGRTTTTSAIQACSSSDNKCNTHTTAVSPSTLTSNNNTINHSKAAITNTCSEARSSNSHKISRRSSLCSSYDLPQDPLSSPSTDHQVNVDRNNRSVVDTTVIPSSSYKADHPIHEAPSTCKNAFSSQHTARDPTTTSGDHHHYYNNSHHHYNSHLTTPPSETLSIHNMSNCLSEIVVDCHDNLALPPSPSALSNDDHSVIRNNQNSLQQNDNHDGSTTTPTQHHDSLIPVQPYKVFKTFGTCESTDSSSENEEEQAKRNKKKERKRKTKPTAVLSLNEDSAQKYHSFKDASVIVLSEVNKPLNATDLTKLIFEKKLVKSAGKTPERTVAAMMYQEIKKKKNASIFSLFGSGLFGLTAWKATSSTNIVNEDQDDSLSTYTSSSSKSFDVTTESNHETSETNKSSKKKRKKHIEKNLQTEEEVIAKRKPRRLIKHLPFKVLSGIASDEENEAIPSAPRKKKKDAQECMNEQPVDLAESPTKDLFSVYVSRLEAKEETKVHEDECFICKNGGELICCDFKCCTKVYHLSCVGISEVPSGDWVCPQHFCSECNSSSVVKKCFTCPYSVCDEHVSLMKDKIDLERFVCSHCKSLCEKHGLISNNKH
ncbi:hypothetical protein C9374_008612 [Naegleria lovaniensis]|uniref:PHD-type domain-containing protein n=1 Tax=Naegleria lovaniensis TaxID=51637 RepID=A0AA88GJK7_NAELO|nr:uncharacterized protein C9374_008612 [Naegleria lovaniensis]KAG2377990.1 hypothetical protein C9374_008612 [Naegleria lovaniensis]